MVREKDLVPFSEPIRVADNEAATYESIIQAVNDLAAHFGAPIANREEYIFRSFLDDDPPAHLVFYHPDHEKDYFNFCIMRKQQGASCLLQVFTMGKSRQMGKEAFQQNVHVFDGNAARGTAVGLLRGGAVGVGFALGSATAGIVKGGAKMLAKGVNALTMDRAALSEEKDWYNIMTDVFSVVFSELLG